MASGDVVSVVHDAGDGTTFSYTSAIDIAITNIMGQSFNILYLNNFVASTTGVIGFLLQSYGSQAIESWGGGMVAKIILKNGQTVNRTDNDIDTNGFAFTGIEL
jgi:hypothetical protein